MQFSVGIWDTLFGERIALEIPNAYGETTKRSVTKKWIDRTQNGKITERSSKQLVRVHLLNVLKGYYVVFWIVGDDITEKMAVASRDPETGDLYALYYYDGEEPKTELMDKAHWEQAHKKFQSYKV